MFSAATEKLSKSPAIALKYNNKKHCAFGTLLLYRLRSAFHSALKRSTTKFAMEYGVAASIEFVLADFAFCAVNSFNYSS